MKVNYRYFLQIDDAPEREVSKAEWVKAESDSGFHGGRPGEPSTGGFTAANGLRGRIKAEVEN